MQQPLEGIRVIDLAQGLAGPGTSMYLADQGAEVIKVEPPAAADGDHVDPVLGNATRSYLVLNRNKRGMHVDLRKPEGRAVLHRLVERADVLVTNMRQAAATRLEADYATLQKLNPRLVYASISAFGPKGPYAAKGGYDLLTQGLSGAMYRRAEDGTPISTGVWLSDPSVPMILSYAIMLALWQREKTGQGQLVQTSLLQAALAMQNYALIDIDRVEQLLTTTDSPSYGVYRCSDGGFVNVTALNSGQFTRLCRLLDLEHLATDARLSDPLRRAEAHREVLPVIQAMFATKTLAEWLSLLEENDVPAAPIVERADVFSEPQIVENEMFTRVDHPRAGNVQMVAPPFSLSGAARPTHRPSPLSGEHTEEILGELGYGQPEVEALRTAGVIQ